MCRTCPIAAVPQYFAAERPDNHPCLPPPPHSQRTPTTLSSCGSLHHVPTSCAPWVAAGRGWRWARCARDPRAPPSHWPWAGSGSTQRDQRISAHISAHQHMLSACTVGTCGGLGRGNDRWARAADARRQGAPTISAHTQLSRPVLHHALALKKTQLPPQMCGATLHRPKHARGESAPSQGRQAHKQM